MSGVYEVAENVNNHSAILVTSVLTRSEILRAHMPPNAESILDRFMQRKNVQEVALDVRMSKLARDIRDHYLPSGVRIKGMDANHLATAIIVGVDEFHTFDGSEESGGRGGLLRFDGNVAGHALRICIPPFQQHRFEGF